MKRPFLTILATAALVTVTGCDENARVARVATDAADRQAEQNRQIAQQNREISGTTKALVEADAQARKEVLAAQKDLQGQQAEVGRQRDQLEAERNEIAKNRHWDPIIAQAITGVGVLLACLLPLVLAWQLLRTAHEEKEDPELTEILIEELASDRPRLIPPLNEGQSLISVDRPSPHSLAGPSEADTGENNTLSSERN